MTVHEEGKHVHHAVTLHAASCRFTSLELQESACLHNELATNGASFKGVIASIGYLRAFCRADTNVTQILA